MNKKVVAVIFGGQSSEHEISRISSVSVIKNLNKEKYDILTLGITKNGEWYLYGGDVEKIEDGRWENDSDNLRKAVISPSAADKGIIVFEKNGTVSIIKTDVFFPVLHGMYGEDGTIQGLLEMSSVPYVGCGVLASSVGMNKIYTKIVFENAGLKQTPWMAVYKREMERDIENCIDRIEEKLGFPVYVKPANAGSSVGISRVSKKEDLKKALVLAAEHDRQIVVEQEIVGREVECSVLGNNEVFAGAVGEVVAPGDGFYDYDEKYKSNTTQLIIPAKLEKDVYEKVRSEAIKAFSAIDGMGVSRVDFFVRAADGEVVINEINTMPGFTSISMYPKLWNAAGKKYDVLLDEMIELAMVREK